MILSLLSLLYTLGTCYAANILNHYSPETHLYLAEESIIEGIRYACTFNRTYYLMSVTERRLDKLLLT